MTTIQVEEEVKRELYAIAAELQAKLGRRVSLGETIKVLVEAYRNKKRDLAGILSLYGCIGPSEDARKLLKELRAGEIKIFEQVAGKLNV
jgi:predicted CopG family antitoxin